MAVAEVVGDVVGALAGAGTGAAVAGAAVTELATGWDLIVESTVPMTDLPHPATVTTKHSINMTRVTLPDLWLECICRA